ncbi:PLP-dependent aminotransferase family protein [Paenibacillus antri]|nr:PLP-dependent aminotransferase family protein [Paenibacillus antri]
MQEGSKYGNIVRYALDRIGEGAWKAGAKLPSVRAMAERNGCSVNTVLRAYEALQSEGYVYAKPKAGFFVAADPDRPSPRATAAIPFDAASPDESAMPYKEFFEYMTKAVFQRRGALFDYGDPQGLPSLRQALAKHLQDVGLFVDERRIFVVSGSQQALQLLVSMPFPNGKTHVLVEQPTYHGMLRALRTANVPAIGLERTESGIDLERLERHFQSNPIKLFYTASRFHNPTGWSYAKSQRESIARLARKYDVYVVEDDYLADLEHDSRNEPIAANDGCDRIVYVKSFSKTLLPGMRLGLAALPPPLVETFREHKLCADFGTSSLSQNALELYLRNGLFDVHRKSVRATYRDRMTELIRVCRETLPTQVTLDAPAGGIFASLFLPKTLPEAEFARALGAAGVPMVPGERFFLPGFPEAKPLMRISVIRADEAAIRRGVELVAAEARRLLRTTPKERDEASGGHWI